MILKVIAIIISYFIGNFSTAVVVSKLFGDVDIREHGSGNAGATNVYRVLGKKAGLITFLGDALKGVLAVWIGRQVGGETFGLVCGVMVIVGHSWPVFFGFRGGKGIATGIGVMLAVNYLSALVCMLVGITIIIKTRYVSLASITGMILLPLLLFFIKGFEYFVFGLVIALISIYRHKANIGRLLKGTESKIK